MKRAAKTIECFNDIRKYLFEHKVPCLQFIRDGKVEVLYTQMYIDEKDKEIERLTKIINELEKWVIDKKYEEGTYCIDCNQVLNKLQELKGRENNDNK